MNIEAWTTVLMSIAPAVSAIITVLCGSVALVKSIKSIHNDNKETVLKSQERIEKMEKKINTIYSKLSSIEQAMVDEQKKLKR